VAEDDIRRVVLRKLHGYDPETMTREGAICCNCGEQPVAARGSEAHEAGVCVECASHLRRTGRWSTRRML
jgi:formylmethanofuran dehydrogenase subunit E